MMKHIGKHDQRKCVLLFKEVPGDDEMCLITYTDTLPKLIHDPMMKCVESEVGQNALDITGPLNRTLMDSGENVLQTLHSQGYIRRVPTNQMIVTPNAATTIRLDELNRILKEMATGKEATARLAELDAQTGMKDPAKTAPIPIAELAESITAPDDGILTDALIAKGQLSQADALAADADRLLSEAANLRDEAYTLAPELKPKAKATRKRVVKAKATDAPAKKRPGRPRKNAAAST